MGNVKGYTDKNGRKVPPHVRKSKLREHPLPDPVVLQKSDFKNLLTEILDDPTPDVWETGLGEEYSDIF